MSYYQVFYKDPTTGNYDFIRNIKTYTETNIETIKNNYKRFYNTNLSNDRIKVKKIRFDKKETYILKNILSELNNGYVYGKQVNNVTYPYFDTVLWKKSDKFIGWAHYGNSSCYNNYNDLRFTLLIIFQVLPSEFIQVYKIKEDK